MDPTNGYTEAYSEICNKPKNASVTADIYLSPICNRNVKGIVR